MPDQLVIALPYASSELGTVVLLGRRRIIQRFREEKALTYPVIPHWAGQVTPIMALVPSEKPLFDEIKRVFKAQTGEDLPLSEAAAEFCPVRDATGKTAICLPVPIPNDLVSTSGDAWMRAFLLKTNLPILGQQVADPVFDELMVASVFALGSAFGSTPEPEGGWFNFMNTQYFTSYRPGALDLLPPTILRQLRTRTKQSGELFALAIEQLPEHRISARIREIEVIGAVLDKDTDTWIAPFQRDGIVQLQVKTTSADPLAEDIVAWEVDGRSKGMGPRLDITTDQIIDQDAPSIVTARLGLSSKSVALAVRADAVRFWVDGAQTLATHREGHDITAATTYSETAAPVAVRLELTPDTVEAYSSVRWSGGEIPPQNPNHARLVPRDSITPKGAPERVTARINPVFTADVAVLPKLETMQADGKEIAADGQIGVVYTGQDDHKVVLRAVTSPDTPEAWAHLDWTGGDPGRTANMRIVSLKDVLPGPDPIDVKVRVDAGDEIAVHIFLAPELRAIRIAGFGENTGQSAGTTFLADEGPPVILVAETRPATQEAADMIVWDGALPWRRTGMAALERTDGRPSVERIKAKIGTQTATLDLTFLKLNAPSKFALSIETIGFANTARLRDDTNIQFSNVWQRGAPAPPLAFVGGNAISLAPTLRVTTAPSQSTDVEVRATAWVPLRNGDITCMRWVSSQLTINASGPIAVPTMTTQTPFAREVSYQVRRDGTNALANQRWDLQILWEIKIAGTQDWAQIGMTNHPTYIMWGTPAAHCHNFQTSFDIACYAADGAKTASEALQGTYRAFRAKDPVTGTNPQMRRTSDGQTLIYWGVGNPAQTLATMLARLGGYGSCLAFSELYHDMMRAQGFAIGRPNEVKPNTSLASDAGAFAVKTWSFNPPATQEIFAAWNWKWESSIIQQGTCRWETGPGQNNPKPPPAFNNHFISFCANQVFDASYGTDPQPDFDTWSRVSIAGLIQEKTNKVGYAGPPPRGETITTHN